MYPYNVFPRNQQIGKTYERSIKHYSIRVVQAAHEEREAIIRKYWLNPGHCSIPASPPTQWLAVSGGSTGGRQHPATNSDTNRQSFDQNNVKENKSLLYNTNAFFLFQVSGAGRGQTEGDPPSRVFC